MDKYREIKKELAQSNTKLVLVTKTKPSSLIQKYYDIGQRDFGENRVQELVEKYNALPKDINWHQIGHLQKNKVKYIAPFIHLIHAVDNLSLLVEINKRAKANNRIITVLLQLKIAKEDSKFGLSKEGVLDILDSKTYKEMENIKVAGLMGMATNTNDKIQIKEEFGAVKKLFDTLKTTYFHDKEYFKEISMGMSGDYKLAIEMGATMVRIGSLIVGTR